MKIEMREISRENERKGDVRASCVRAKFIKIVHW